MTLRTTPEPGTVCRVSSERGAFTFVRATTSASGAVSWYLLDDHQQFRAFRPERVTIPRKRTHQLQLG